MTPAHLEIEQQTHSGRTHEIASEETLIGRGLAADVQLADPGASRDHAMITWEGDHYALEDLQTTNGTRLNGKKIRNSALAAGDVIEIGHSRLVFRCD
jgi:pSer/pThr/pTyr-binding forkhead associated (FHA) protein